MAQKRLGCIFVAQPAAVGSPAAAAGIVASASSRPAWIALAHHPLHAQQRTCLVGLLHGLPDARHQAAKTGVHILHVLGQEAFVARHRFGHHDVGLADRQALLGADTQVIVRPLGAQPQAPVRRSAQRGDRCRCRAGCAAESGPAAPGAGSPDRIVVAQAPAGGLADRLLVHGPGFFVDDQEEAETVHEKMGRTDADVDHLDVAWVFPQTMWDVDRAVVRAYRQWQAPVPVRLQPGRPRWDGRPGTRSQL